MSTGPSYSTGAPSYNTGPGPQADMFSRRPGSAVPSGGYPPVGGGKTLCILMTSLISSLIYTEGYDRPDAYGPPPRGGGRYSWVTVLHLILSSVTCDVNAIRKN
ncbi:RNA-binding protein 4-like isoform X1 [Vespula maculifrons]|uniref:RNA-binding protein 4-like isoform X1 n=1 Tax=Vespula maculifrons TaxID=7453 RepID=A0ABD2AT24_VESMC